MGWREYHQVIAEQCPQLVEEFIELEEAQYDTIGIGGLKGGVTLTHMMKYVIPFTVKDEQCYYLTLARDLPINIYTDSGFSRIYKDENRPGQQKSQISATPSIVRDDSQGAEENKSRSHKIRRKEIFHIAPHHLSLVVHKRAAALNTNLAEMGGDLVSNSLELNLGFYNFGRYTKAPDDMDYASFKN